jgi:hypothetical protein
MIAVRRTYPHVSTPAPTTRITRFRHRASPHGTRPSSASATTKLDTSLAAQRAPSAQRLGGNSSPLYHRDLRALHVSVRAAQSPRSWSQDMGAWHWIAGA